MNSEESLNITRLLLKFHREELTEEENQYLINWSKENESNNQIYNRCLEEREISNQLKDPIPINDKILWSKVLKGVDFKQQGVRYRWVYLRNMAAAAIVVLFVGAAFYLMRSTKPASQGKIQSPTEIAKDIAPGGNRAILVLSDGSKVDLESSTNGLISKQGNSSVSKLSNGQLAYKKLSTEKPSTIVFNSLTTPKGGTYELLLPDGSKVWLNSSSSIRYPTSFWGKTRDVEISGEAYLEIARNPGMPFSVKTSGQLVEVLGTAFNINSYPNEPIERTTLVSGSIKISIVGSGRTQRVKYPSNPIILKPGQESQISQTRPIDTLGYSRKKIIVLKDVDMDATTAWKNGEFEFAKADLDYVMRQLERWYDIQVTYKSLPNIRLSGTISRNVALSSVLKMLELNGVKFSVAGNKISITN